MTQKSVLIRQCYFNIAIDDYTLAAQARINARVYRPVNKIFFFVRYFLDVIHPLVYVHLAGTAAAYAAAIVLQFDAVFQANIKH